MSTSVEVEIVNPSGIHARPAATFYKEIRKFRSTVTVQNVTKGGDAIETRSLITIISKLGAVKGNTIRITADGADEQAAVDSLRALVESGLGE